MQHEGFAFHLKTRLTRKHGALCCHSRDLYYLMWFPYYYVHFSSSTGTLLNVQAPPAKTGKEAGATEGDPLAKEADSDAKAAKQAAKAQTKGSGFGV